MFLANMNARFAIEEGLVDVADVYSDYDESEEEQKSEYEEFQQIYGHYIPNEVYQRWYRRRKRKDTEKEALFETHRELKSFFFKERVYEHILSLIL